MAATEEDGHAGRPYLGVMIVLAVLTVIEVYTPNIAGSRDIVIPLLLAIATAKAAFVVAYYMHLKYETTAIRIIPFVPLVFVFILLLALFFGIQPA